jgi:hypothetical protein
VEQSQPAALLKRSKKYDLRINNGARDRRVRAGLALVARIGASKAGGERVSKKEEERSETDSNENLAFRQGQPDLNSSILNEIKFQVGKEPPCKLKLSK